MLRFESNSHISEGVEEVEQQVHPHHNLGLRVVQVEALHHRVGDVVPEVLAHQPTQQPQQRLLRYDLPPHLLQLRQQLLALGQDEPPDLLVLLAAALPQSVQGGIEGDHAVLPGCSGLVVVDHLAQVVVLHDVSRQLGRLLPLQPQWLVHEQLYQSPASQLALRKQLRQLPYLSVVELVVEDDEGQLDLLDLDGPVQFDLGVGHHPRLLPALLPVLGLEHPQVLPLVVELVPQVLHHALPPVVGHAQLVLLLVLVVLHALDQLLVLLQLLVLGVQQLLLTLHPSQFLPALLDHPPQPHDLLALLALLLHLELVDPLEQQVLVLVVELLDLGLLVGQLLAQLLALLPELEDLPLLDDLPRLEQVLVVLVLAHRGLQLLVLLLHQPQELVFEVVLGATRLQRADDRPQPDGLPRQVLLLHAALVEHAHVGQVLQLLYLLLQRDVVLVQLLDLLLEDLGVDRLLLPLLLLLYPPRQPLLHPLQQLRLPLRLPQSKLQPARGLPLLLQLLLEADVLLGDGLVVPLLELGVVLLFLGLGRGLLGGPGVVQQLLEDVLLGGLEVLDALEVLLAAWGQAYKLWSLWRVRLFFDRIRFIRQWKCYNYKAPIHQMSLDRFLNMKPKAPKSERMEVENPEAHRRMPWVEKYRPSRLDELAHQEEVTHSLKNVLKTGNLPHLLFYGPAGTGKTSAIMALSKELFGPQFYRERVMELNASDERGIGVVRDKVKRFAQTMSAKNPDKNYACPPYKIIVLDEADLLTSEAQSALRRVIEDNSATTRFCLICNYITKIIEPVSSRFVKFRFKPIPADAQLAKLREIAGKEEVKINEEHLRMLLEKGDLRQSINSLQSLSGLSTVPDLLLPAPDQLGNDILDRIGAASCIEEVYYMGKEIIHEGYAYDEVLNVLVKAVARKTTDERKKAIIVERIGKAEESLLQGAVEMPILEVLASIYFVAHMKL